MEIKEIFAQCLRLFAWKGKNGGSIFTFEYIRISDFKNFKAKEK